MADQQAQVDRSVIRVKLGLRTGDRDTLAAEEPMELRLIWHERGEPRRDSIAVTMRTPGDDFELAVGFLHGEGIISSRVDFVDVAYCVEGDGPQTFNIVTVTLSPGVEFDFSRLDRHFYTTSSCGVCGKASLEALDIRGCQALDDDVYVAADTIGALPARLLRSQDTFQRTGGLHAAGLFSREGALLCLREDVGRHNALDKVIGTQLVSGSQDFGMILMLSGRASFELLQKALMARIPIVAAVGAPSSLAVDLARSYNITLVGFVRRDSFNIYSADHRIKTSDVVAVNDVLSTSATSPSPL